MSDAWIFATLGYRGQRDGVSLRSLVAAADRINHAIPTEAEFTTAVGRLVAAGLAGADAAADRYRPMEAGRALYARRMRRRGPSGWLRAIAPALDRLGEPVDPGWSLPPGTFARAVRGYLEQ
jgi:hypothetical protein